MKLLKHREKIDSFNNEYHFLSNFYLHYQTINNIVYKSNEHWYQSEKTNNPIKKWEIINAISPNDAKNFGKLVKLVKNWDIIKIEKMWIGLQVKFKEGILLDKLLRTYNKELIEGNQHHDNFWGHCYCKKCRKKQKYNMLGMLLMKLRKEKIENYIR